MPPASDPRGDAHNHIFLAASHDDNARRTRWVVALTAVMMVVEIVAGWATGSMALLADGVHMATHAGALSVAAIAYAYARRHADSPAYSFGTGKVGDLAGFASALLLGLFSAGIAIESFQRLLQPAEVAFGDATLVAVVGLIVNLASAWLLAGGHGHHRHHTNGHGHDHGHAHTHDGDNNLRSAYVHVLADALTSVLAIAALLAGRYLGWGWMDPAMGLVGAVVIARWSWSLMGQTAAVLLDRSDERLAAEVRARVEAGGDARIADLHVWQVGPGARAAIVSVTGRAEAEAIRARLAPMRTLNHLTVECRAG